MWFTSIAGLEADDTAGGNAYEPVLSGDSTDTESRNQMSITRNEAREVTTADEQELVEESFYPAVRAFDSRDLKSRITRARKLRDKYRDLSQRQGIASKRKGRGGSGDNERSRMKARLFSETLERLEKQLVKVSHEEANEPKA
jgi:hypothetical protein